ncbi:hypothetical protein M1523_03870 [Patescibacteria group bacterium]|nr:hypothetical protein [Patescibacteria group bacterium]MCL5091831.1 hypothetical protein [Patescibacteria group bacterium]
MANAESGFNPGSLEVACCHSGLPFVMTPDMISELNPISHPGQNICVVNWSERGQEGRRSQSIYHFRIPVLGQSAIAAGGPAIMNRAMGQLRRRWSRPAFFVYQSESNQGAMVVELAAGRQPVAVYSCDLTTGQIDIMDLIEREVSPIISGGTIRLTERPRGDRLFIDPIDGSGKMIVIVNFGANRTVTVTGQPQYPLPQPIMAARQAVIANEIAWRRRNSA